MATGSSRLGWASASATQNTVMPVDGDDDGSEGGQTLTSSGKVGLCEKKSWDRFFFSHPVPGIMAGNFFFTLRSLADLQCLPRPIMPRLNGHHDGSTSPSMSMSMAHLD